MPVKPAEILKKMPHSILIGDFYAGKSLNKKTIRKRKKLIEC